MHLRSDLANAQLCKRNARPNKRTTYMNDELMPRLVGGD